MTYSFAEYIQARTKRMESGSASTILAWARRRWKAEGRMKNAEVLALPSPGARTPKARKIPGGDPEKSLGIFGLVAHITAFTQ
jgi:hypothetical protein